LRQGGNLKLRTKGVLKKNAEYLLCSHFLYFSGSHPEQDSTTTTLPSFTLFEWIFYSIFGIETLNIEFMQTATTNQSVPAFIRIMRSNGNGSNMWLIKLSYYRLL